MGGTMVHERSSSRLRDDDGAVVAEFALILPFLVFLILGIFEFGMLFRQEIALSSAVQTAARTGSHSGKQPTADQLTLTNLSALATNISRTSIDKVVIYNSNSTTNGALPSNCATTPAGSGVNGLCNVYSFTQMNTAATSSTNFGDASGCTSTDWDRWWCPTTRDDQLATSPDQFGVSVTATYTYITKIIPWSTTKTITDYAVYRVEATG
jgi:Flp pilus assembly protein TadG